MSCPIEAARTWVSEYEARDHSPAGSELRAELDHSVQVCRELLKESERLRAELDQAHAERDNYLDALYEASRVDFNLPKAEALAHFGKQRPLRELIAELEREGT